jgi:enoyl-CoA hydratase
MDGPVLFSVDDHTATITLNRPERRNAINQALLKSLYDCLDEVASNEGIRAAIITGSGKTFCSGLDLSVLGTDRLFDPRGDGSDLIDILGRCRKPIIGAVNGHAITGGFELALNCDFLIASENASFADTHAKVGIHPGWGMTQLLQEAIGRRRALQMSLTCQFISAEKAHQWGLVNEVVPPDMLMPRARQIASAVGAVNQDMLHTVKSLIEFRSGSTLIQALARERDGFIDFLKRSNVLA